MVSIDHLIRPEIRALSAYKVADANGMLKLDAMENPFSLSAEIKQQWLAALEKVNLNRYPEPSPQALANLLRTVMHIPVGAELLFGNGSDELIQILCLALAKNSNAQQACLLAPEPGFVMYQMTALFTGLNYIGVPLNPVDFSLPEEAMCTAIEKYQPALIFLAYPNNPSGNLFDEALIEKIIQQAPGLVVIDEAYQPFAKTTLMPWLARYDNLLLMRTVSKLGLAGLRFGYLAGASAWVTEFNKVRMPYNINTLTQASMEFALQHISYFDRQAEILCEQRQLLLTQLQALSTVKAFASDANFILFRTLANADEVFAALKAAGILIKNLHKPDSSLENCLRVTVGTPDENQRFMAALTSILNT